MKETLLAYLFMSIRQGATLIFSIARSKILAITLGAPGVGLVAQANTLIETLAEMAVLGTGPGINSMLARMKADQRLEEAARLIRVAFLLYTSIGLVLLLVGLAFAEPVAIWAFNDASLAPYIIVLSVAILLIIQNRVLINTLRGWLEWRAYIIAVAIGYLISTLSTVGLVYWLGKPGAVFSLLATQLVMYIAYQVAVRLRVVLPNPAFDLPAEQAQLKQLLRFASVLFFVQLITPVAELILRAAIIRGLGLSASGIYQVVWGVSKMYMGFVVETKVSYTLPRVSAAGDDLQARTLIQNQAIRSSLFLLGPGLVLLATAWSLWIPLLYSNDFLMAGAFLGWQVAADLLMAVRYHLNISFLPLRKFMPLLIEAVVGGFGWVLLAEPLLPVLGLMAVPVSGLIIQVILFIATLLYQYRLGFRISSENAFLVAGMILFVAGGLWVAGASGLGMWLALLVNAILSGAFLLALSTPAEKAKVLGSLQARLAVFRKP